MASTFGSTCEPNFIGPFSDISISRTLFNKVMDIGMKLKTQHKVTPEVKVPPSQITFDDMPLKGTSYDQILTEYKNIAAGSVNWSSPNFMGFPDCGNSLPAVAASILIPLLNQNLCNQDVCSPTATFKEMEIVHWLRSNLGYPTPKACNNVLEIGGALTVGGSLSNAIAMVAALERCFPGSGYEGLPVLAKDVRVLVPDIVEHYSTRSALPSISLGGDKVVRVPVDEDFRMVLPELERCIDEEQAAGRHVMACIAYAGDPRTMSIDNLPQIAGILARRRIWFHVDACHGQSLAFSRKHRHKLFGIELADSVTIDRHKEHFVPYQNSFVLFKTPESLTAIGVTTEFVLKTQWSIGQITPFIGSKSCIIDARLDLTAAIQQEIENNEDLVLLNKTDINACIMLFLPAAVQKAGVKLTSGKTTLLNESTKELKFAIQESGDFYIHGFPLRRMPHPLLPDDHAVYVLRTMQGNPLTTIDNVRALLDRAVTTGKVIPAGNQSKSAKL